jgi:TetR/AcrR family transcriptional regulator, transcriptional repressor for nem operon
VERSGIEIRAAYEDELQRVIATFARGLPGAKVSERRAKAWAILGLLAGGLTMSRAVRGKKTGDEIALAVVETASAISQ